ncbi:hypothetical protein [Azohydromonas australica]|uniref:hypothetical protein n=1 Tax=Azohydromonas australica TaxID=364039 RepID=UPI000409CA85|nr:hypothetical protein [Azohydromonas australica]
MNLQQLQGLNLPGFGPIEVLQAEVVEVSGLALRDGAWRIGRLQLRGIELRTPTLALRAGQVLLRGLSVRLGAARPDGGSLPLQALALDALELQDTQVELARAPSPAAAGELARWRMDALAGLDGRLQMHVDDAAWIMDAELGVTIQDGRIDFNRLSVEHIGPDSPMGVSHMGIYADSPKGRDYLYQFTLPHVPGVRFEQRGSLFGARVTDRGSLELKPFVESLLHNAGCGTPQGQPGRNAAPALQRTRLSGELNLGDGVMGTLQQYVELSGQAQGRNRVGVSAASMGRQVVLRLPDLQAARALFSLPGLPGGSGAITGTVSVTASSPGNGPALRLAVERLAVQALRLGDGLQNRSG